MSLDPQHGVIGLRHAGRLVWRESEPFRDHLLQPALSLAIRREFRQLLQRSWHINQVSFAGVVQQSPERITERTKTADVNGVLGDRVNLEE